MNNYTYKSINQSVVLMSSLLRRINMGRGSRGSTVICLTLVLLILLPSVLTVAASEYPMKDSSNHQQSLFDISVKYDDKGNFLISPDLSDSSHGWEDKNKIGEAYLFYRTANYVPINDWSKITNQNIMDGWYVLAHDYPVPSNWKESLADSGIACYSYLPPQGFHCHVSQKSPYELADLGVIGSFQLDVIDKLAPDLVPIMNGEDYGSMKEGKNFVINIILSGPEEGQNLLDNGINLIMLEGIYAEVVVDEKEILWLSNQEYVEWMEPKYPARLFDDKAAEILGIDHVWDASYMGGSGNVLTGDGVIIGVADSGLDNANVCTSISSCMGNNPSINSDFQGRIKTIITGSNGPASCDDNDPADVDGHGTHVTGSAVGDGSNSGGFFKGMAYESQLWFYAMDELDCANSGLYVPSNFVSGIATPAYEAGVRVQTNSWGTDPQSSSPNYYNSYSKQIDQAAYTYEDLVILFALGNEGKDSNADGEIDTSWIQPQAVTKNGFSIGATENNRPSLSITCDLYPGNKFPAEPIATDSESNNIDGVWCNSNRGPTQDGRIKPDLVAPGTRVVSVLSSEDSEGSSVFIDMNGDGIPEEYSDYTYKSGTSMATPLAAGAAALLIENLNNAGYLTPSSALIKGIFSATSIDMEGQYGGSNGAAQTTPNNHEGWGRINVQDAISSSFLDQLEITTSESKSIRLSIPIGTPSFDVILSWTDSHNIMVSSCSTQCLVNDLDITLKDPSGNIYGQKTGNINNLLGLSVDSPDAGDWEIIVTGTNVPEGPQKFAIVVSDNYMLTDMSQPVSGSLNNPGFQEGSIFTETTLSIGNGHFCAILDDSSVNCWGDNSEGQLGDGTTADRQTMTPVNFGIGRTAVSISSGNSHTCAILDDASLKCWGSNSQGQLGDGSVVDSSIPLDIDLGSDVPITISAGSYHTCVVLATANLKCWGDNSDGQLGDGTVNSIYTPSYVDLGSDLVLAISTGGSHTCAITNTPDLKCWGDNSHGQLGDSSTSDRYTPTMVALSTTPVAVSTGDMHTCTILSDTTLSCWGDNSQGQLGDGTNVNSNSPISNIVSGVSSVSLGNSHSCVLDTTNILKCWGDNTFSQLGDGTDSSQNTPLAISFTGGKFPISVSSGGHYTCSSTSNDMLRCWGLGDIQSLDIGLSPTDVILPRWSYINAAERDLDDDSILNIFDTHVSSDADGDGYPSGSDSDDNNPAIAATCGIGEYGRYYCQEATVGFYVNTIGSLIKIPASPGNYVDTNGATSQSPCSIGTFQKLSGMDKCDDANAGYYVSSIGSSAQIACPGGTYNPLSGSNSPTDCIGSDPGFNVPILTDVNAGTSHSCAILDDGAIRCWGSNGNGQLGDGSRDDKLAPTVVNTPLGRIAISVSTGLAHSCAIFDDGSLRCWGDNSQGQLGDGTTVERTVPTLVNLGNGRSASSITLGQTHTCSILDDNSVKCWGGNANGQVGDGSTSDRNIPTKILFDGSDVISLSAGSYHTCAILINSSIECWGDNWHGQLGDGSNDRQLTPKSLGNQYQSRSISSGAFHTCSIMINNSLYCWGFNSGGQLGNGNYDNFNLPNPVPLSENQIPSIIESGFHHTCSVLDNGKVICWGDNAKGQLGDGTNNDRIIADEVDIPIGRSALSISVGQRHSCAILDDATLYCWGYNSNGQLGNGNIMDKNAPENIDLNHGSGFQTACVPGTYQPSSGQTSCSLAAKGHDAPNSSSLDQSPCKIGHYSNIRGLANCVEASLGYYVETVMAIDQIACPELKSTIRTASNSLNDCILDTDGDSIVDINDLDDDNDGVPDAIDFDPLDPNISADTDSDQIPDNIDPDDDNDGVNDTYTLQTLDSNGNIVYQVIIMDAFPLDRTEWSDTDSDGIGDNTDLDDDNDGRTDNFDTFSSNKFEWSDYDGDQLGDNFDADDDGDGVCDTNTGTSFVDSSNNNYGGNHNIGSLSILTSLGEEVPLIHPSVLNYLPPSYPLIYPSDFVNLSNRHPVYIITLEYCNLLGDEFPLDPSEYIDTDGDTLGNNLDKDDDNDGYEDSNDSFELDPNEWSDLDGDNKGDNFDLFDNDPLEWMDSDGDSVGDNSDGCIFEPGLNSSYVDIIHLLAIGNIIGCIPDPNLNIVEEEEPEIPEFLSIDFLDLDNDGEINLLDIDDDGDNIPDAQDSHPYDPTRPFDQDVYLLITLTSIFLVFMLFRLVNWQKTKIAKFRSKRIHLE